MNYTAESSCTLKIDGTPVGQGKPPVEVLELEGASSRRVTLTKETPWNTITLPLDDSEQLEFVLISASNYEIGNFCGNEIKYTHGKDGDNETHTKGLVLNSFHYYQKRAEIVKLNSLATIGVGIKDSAFNEKLKEIVVEVYYGTVKKECSEAVQG